MFKNTLVKLYTDKDSYISNEKLFKTISTENCFKVTACLKTPTPVFSASVEIPLEISDSCLLYGGGYQSWSYSAEYKPTDKQRTINPLVKHIPIARTAAQIVGDYDFVESGKGITSITYTYKREGNELEFFGSLNENSGFTVFYFDYQNQKLIIKKDLQGVTLQNGAELFDIYFKKGSYDEVFDAYFAQMKIDKSKMKRLCGYTSWYNYFDNINENIILRDLQALAGLKCDEVNIFQIDDGYQQATGDWLLTDPDKFPKGMKYIADNIHQNNMLAGLWLAPFSVSRESRIFKEHSDWLICVDEEPVVGSYAWGKSHTLDFYNLEVQNYLRKVFSTVLNEWGFDMVKLDFLYSECIPRAGKSRGQIMCEAMDFLRECVGDKLLLGCGVPIGAAFGRVDMCRTSCDVNLKAKSSNLYNGICKEIPSLKNAITTNLYRRHLDGRAFMLDPDVFFVRKENLKYTKNQKNALAFVNNLVGSVLFVSDDISQFDDEQIRLLKMAYDKREYQLLDVIKQGKSLILTVNKKGNQKRFNLIADKGIFKITE